MPTYKKLCLVKDNHELLKIIPFDDKGNIGFKIFLRANIEIRFHTINYCNLAYVGPICTSDTQLEFTYHAAGGGKKTNLHYKTTSAPSHHYWDIPFSNIAEPTKNQILPIPFCKIVCNDSSIFPEYHTKSKNEKFVLDEKMEYNMDLHNVAEIYITSPWFEPDKMITIWDIFFMAMQLLPIEYYSVPTPENTQHKILSMGNGRNLLSSRIYKLLSEMSFMVSTYYSSELSVSNYFSFFENGKYVEHLAVTRLCYKDEHGAKTDIKPLYQWQLEKNKTLLSESEITFWEDFFLKAEYELAPRLRSIIVQNL